MTLPKKIIDLQSNPFLSFRRDADIPLASLHLQFTQPVDVLGHRNPLFAFADIRRQVCFQPGFRAPPDFDGNVWLCFCHVSPLFCPCGRLILR